MSSASKTNLQKVFEYSFPQNNLLLLSLMREVHPNNVHKNQHFCFISLVPGEKSSETSTGRTFSYDKRITIKCEPDKVLALANAIQDCAQGLGEKAKFNIFADPSKSTHGNGGEIKALKVAPGNDGVQVALMFSEGKTKSFPFIVPPALAKAIAKVCDMVGTKAIDLEFERQQNDFAMDFSRDHGSFDGPAR